MTFDKSSEHRGVTPTASPPKRALMRSKTGLLQGSLDLIILKTLTLEPLHGWAVSKKIQLLSRGVLEVNQGSLYPALYRLRDRGLIQSEQGLSDEGRAVKIYRLTAKGRTALTAERAEWKLFSGALEAILATG
jgi:PadR family transcriptional regulator PadR